MTSVRGRRAGQATARVGVAVSVKVGVKQVSGSVAEGVAASRAAVIALNP